jgi:hypothetical protein
MRRPGAKVMGVCTCLSTRSRRWEWCVALSIKQRAEVKSTMDAFVGQKQEVRLIGLVKMFTREEGGQPTDDRETHSGNDPPLPSPPLPSPHLTSPPQGMLWVHFQGRLRGVSPRRRRRLSRPQPLLRGGGHIGEAGHGPGRHATITNASI